MSSTSETILIFCVRVAIELTKGWRFNRFVVEFRISFLLLCLATKPSQDTITASLTPLAVVTFVPLILKCEFCSKRLFLSRVNNVLVIILSFCKCLESYIRGNSCVIRANLTLCVHHLQTHLHKSIGILIIIFKTVYMN